MRLRSMISGGLLLACVLATEASAQTGGSEGLSPTLAAIKSNHVVRLGYRESSPPFSFLDMGRSATNVIGNTLATSVVAKWEGELAPEHALGPDDVVPPSMIPGEMPAMAGH